MPSPSLTYTLTNGSTADASQVMQNFNDLLNGMTDGTKDLSIAALTAAGTATLNGHVNLGNASADDLTVNASLASTIPIKTTNSFDIGSSSLGLRALYFGANSQTVNIKGSASMSATYTLTLPVNAGTNGYLPATDGSGTLSWVPNLISTSAKSADYTVTDTDGIRTILMTTGSTNRTVTLPTAADNTNRILTIKKVDSGTGKVTTDGENSETIDGYASIDITNEDDSITIQCDGSAWHVLDSYTSGSSILALISDDYTIADTDGYTTINVTTGGSDRTITLPSAAATNKGKRVTIRKYDSGTGAVLISGTVDGSSSSNVNRINKQYGRGTLISDGSAWYWDEEITETGVWSAALAQVGGSGSVTSDSLETPVYHRRGSVVHVRAYLRTTAISSPSAGEAMITGLPYTASASGSGTLAVGVATSWGTNYPFCARVNSSATTAVLVYRDAVDGTTAFMSGGDWASGSNNNAVSVSGSYYLQT